MADFVRRAGQNFASHPSLQRVAITVDGVTESWWLAAVPGASGGPVDSLAIWVAAAAGILRKPANTDLGAAKAFSRLVLAASAVESTNFAWDKRLELLSDLKFVNGVYPRI